MIVCSYSYIFLNVVMDCGDLMAPAHGTLIVTGTTFRNIALYQCDDGHMLVGLGEVPSRMCLANGTWSESQPRCECKLWYCVMIIDITC